MIGNLDEVKVQFRAHWRGNPKKNHLKSKKVTMRKHNTKKDGSAWSDEAIQKIWEKGRSIPNYSDAIWRHDICGAVMKYSDHGNRDSDHGWEIDHINPVSNGGDDNYYNLQPLNWSNNATKGDQIIWRCK